MYIITAVTYLYLYTNFKSYVVVSNILLKCPNIKKCDKHENKHLYSFGKTAATKYFPHNPGLNGSSVFLYNKLFAWFYKCTKGKKYGITINDIIMLINPH